MADVSTEKQSYSAFERFMFMMIPILFVIVLLGVLFYVFDAEFRNRALIVGQSVPVLKNVLPEPKVEGNSMNDDTIRAINMMQKIEELEAELAAVKSELETATEAASAQEQAVKDLQDENAQLKLLGDEQLLDDEQYAARITELAGMFSRMTPSKAAPIVQSMTTDEIVLLFSAMRADDRVRIMERMDPRIAAEATMKLKDNVRAKDLQIAALQARLEQEAEADSAVSSTLNQEQLSATFTSMSASSAGELLVKMIEVSPSKVIRILNSVGDATRSSILSEMSKLDQTATANIVSRLMPES